MPYRHECGVSWCRRERKYAIGVCETHANRGGRVEAPRTDHEAARAVLVEEVEWFLSFGMHPDRVARRLGFRDAGSLYRKMLTLGRRDLAGRLRVDVDGVAA